jgi:hypothetical protein
LCHVIKEQNVSDEKTFYAWHKYVSFHETIFWEPMMSSFMHETFFVIF